eukprot:TRINITY_DN10784_c0_g2_i3.p1 TRINITY_DN10784_c0_g2~~TRINITY_DN10784_c0_g2_i3.p1  ORF type:complete len:542 (-),score=74.84 TRINITY_DN10784_c0_g2_i3:69-1694(-)
MQFQRTKVFPGPFIVKPKNKPKLSVKHQVLQTEVQPNLQQTQLQTQSFNQLQQWLQLDLKSKDIVPQYEIFQCIVDGQMCLLCTCNMDVEINGKVHTAISILLQSEQINDHNQNTSQDKFPELSLHWGVSRGKGHSWKPPPPGWFTYPDFSRDAGNGAWQTPLENQINNNQYCAQLVIPKEGVLQEGGMSFVLVTSDGQWIKDASSHEDFFTNLNFQMRNKYQSKIEKNLYKKDTKQQQREYQLGERSQTLTNGMTLSQIRVCLENLSNLQLANLDLNGSAYNSSQQQTQAKDSEAVSDTLLSDIKSSEPKAERSLMHRYQLALQLLNQYEPLSTQKLTAISSWLALSSARHLTWNRNYNVKPREISAAQDEVTKKLAQLYQNQQLRQGALMGMRAIGRGGTGDVGQRIRDEILSIQSRNHAKGGMMEEWHQKLHNNTSPDDIVICKALLAYVRSPSLDISEYWNVLHAENVTKERLASFDRPIVSEPKFSKDQCQGLERDLEAYLHTLEAVHGAKDLYSATVQVLGYEAKQVKGKRVVPR